MKSTVNFFLITLISCFILVGCQSTTEVETGDEQEANVFPEVNEEELAYEDYALEVDMNDSLGIGKSLFYTKPTGESIEVEIFVNSENQTVKIIERYTTESTRSVCKNIFYLKDGKKYISKELFEEPFNDEFQFVERVTYYDENEKPSVTKRKTAPYEEELGLEAFTIVEAQDCSMQRALDVLNQTGSFATTFQGFVKEDVFLYMIVGENEKDGYSSSLVVQQIDFTINKLQNDELAMIGMPLIIEFESIEDAGEGFEYQILQSAKLR